MSYAESHRRTMSQRFEAERRKRWVRRLFYRVQDDLGIGLKSIAIILLAVVVIMWYGLKLR